MSMWVGLLLMLAVTVLILLIVAAAQYPGPEDPVNELDGIPPVLHHVADDEREAA
jgi:hypothetical protein